MPLAEQLKVVGLPAGQQPHTHVKSTLEWFKKKHWTVLEWPEKSPDMNYIHNLWQELKTEVGRGHPSNIEELEQFAAEKWAKLLSTNVQRAH
jgi:transposase